MTTLKRAERRVHTVIRGALDAIKDQRPAVEVPREALVKIAAELRRLGKLLDEERAWDPLDVARYLGTSRSWVYGQAEAGTLPCTRLGGLLRFDPRKIKALARGEAKAEDLGGRVVALPSKTK